MLNDFDKTLFLENDDLRHLLTVARCILWQATIERQPWGLDWRVSLIDEDAARRWLPVPIAPGQSFPNAWSNAKLPEDQLRTDAVSVEAVISGQARYSQEYRCRLIDGQICWLAEDVQIISLGPGRWRLVGVCTDITQLKRTEAELQQVIEEREGLLRELSEAYRREQSVSQTLQQALLLMPPENAFPGLVVSSLYEAAMDDIAVGGDFCDAFALSDNQVALALGDVTGKGLAAAAQTVEIKFNLRNFLRDDPSPASAMTRLNQFLCEQQRLDKLAMDTLASLSLIVLDTHSGIGSAAVAAMEAPLIFTPKGQARAVQASGLPLGALPHSVYTEVPILLRRDEVLLLATDGITEARCRQRFLGVEGLKRLAKRALVLETLSEINRAILEGAKNFASLARLNDDICILLVRRQ